jgi:hypothetical protein
MYINAYQRKKPTHSQIRFQLPAIFWEQSTAERNGGNGSLANGRHAS